MKTAAGEEKFMAFEKTSRHRPVNVAEGSPTQGVQSYSV